MTPFQFPPYPPARKPAEVVEVRVAGRAYVPADQLDALAVHLRGFIEWAEEYRDQCKRAGERPAIDAHRVNRAKAALRKAGRT